MMKGSGSKSSRREFLKKNLLAASALILGMLGRGVAPELKDEEEKPNIGMKPARFYKELAG